MGWQHLDMRGIGTETVCGHNHVERRVVLTSHGEKAFGGMALAIIFVGAVLCDNGLRHQGNDFALIGMHARCPQHLMSIGHRAMSMRLFSTRRTVNLCGGARARAIEGQEVVTLDTHPLLERLASLELTKDLRERWPQGRGIHRIASLAHRRIAWHALKAIDPWQVVFGSLFVKGEQRGGFA